MMLVSHEVCKGDSRTDWQNIHDFAGAALDRFVQEQAGVLVRDCEKRENSRGGWGEAGMLWLSVSPSVFRATIAIFCFCAHLFLQHVLKIFAGCGHTGGRPRNSKM